MHVDEQVRYHFVIETNPAALFFCCFDAGDMRCIGYHVPDDSRWYRVDTRREHFVYNAGWEPRIHLVCCPL